MALISAQNYACALLTLITLCIIYTGSVDAVTLFTFKNPSSASGFPVILVPGDGGSQLEAKINKPSVVHRYCSKKTDTYFDLWLNLESLVPLLFDCWVDNMRLVYSNVTRRTSNSPGVDIRVPGFGNTTTVEYLDPSQISLTAYFRDIVASLAEAGYMRGISIRAAPYDFRRAPNELEQYFVNLKNLIEDTYLKNNKTPVVLVAHSMGSPFMLYFLNGQTLAWKNQYIRALVTLAGVWGGAVKALKAFASGDNLGTNVLSALKLRAEQRTSSSLAFLLPSDKFWPPTETLISTVGRNYTTADYAAFFQDINYIDGYEMWKDTRSLIYDLKPPEVEVHCLHGANVSTDSLVIYQKNSFPDSPTKIVVGDGDGTVNFRSLIGCLRWQGQQSQKVYHKVFPGIDHMGIIVHPPVLDYIKLLVTTKRKF